MQLGFSRRNVVRPASQSRRAIKRRRLGFDCLEDRRLLSISTAGAEFQVPTPPGVQLTGNHSVAMDANGDAAAVWADSQTTNSNGQPIAPWNVGFQLYNNSGGTLSPAGSGAVTAVNLYSNVQAQVATPMIARAPTYGSSSSQGSNFVVVWNTESINSSGFYVFSTYAQLFDGGGHALTSRMLVGGSGDNRIAGVAMDDAGFDVLYASYAVSRKSVSDQPTWTVQRYSPTGSAEGSPIKVATAYDTSGGASISMDETGNFVVGWTDKSSTSSQTFVEVNRYSSTGAAEGSGLQLNTSAFSPVVDLAMDSNDDFVVAWYPGGGAFVAQTVYADNTLGAQNVVDPASNGTSQMPVSIAMQPDGSYALSWTDESAAHDFTAMADTFSRSGAAQQPPLTVYANGIQGLWQVTSAAIDNAGDLLVVYSGTGPGWITDGGVFGDYYPQTSQSQTASQLGVSAPANVTAGVPFNVTVTAQDANGVTVTGYTGTVALTDSNGNSLGSVMVASGVGRLSVTLNATGSYTLLAGGTDTGADTGNPITGSSNAVNVYGQATHFAVSAPANATAGSEFTVTVTALDANGSAASGYTGTVNLTTSDGKAALPASVTLVDGTGTFSVTLKTAGNQTITATDNSNSSLTVTSGAITVSAAAASQFILSAPSKVTSGAPFSLTVDATDAYGNVVTNYASAVTIASGGSTLASGTLTDGVGTFSLVLNKTGNPHKSQQQTITVTDGSITSSIVVTVN